MLQYRHRILDPLKMRPIIFPFLHLLRMTLPRKKQKISKTLWTMSCKRVTRIVLDNLRIIVRVVLWTKIEKLFVNSWKKWKVKRMQAIAAFLILRIHSNHLSQLNWAVIAKMMGKGYSCMSNVLVMVCCMYFSVLVMSYR